MMLTQHIKEHPFSTDTVKKHMVTHLCTGSPDDTVTAYLAKLRACTSPIETLVEVYVVDAHGVLLGYIELPEILKCDPSKKLSELMNKDVVYVHTHTDRERAARLAIHTGHDVLPVVDKEKHLIGLLSMQDILRILHEENIEDHLRVAGFRRRGRGGAFINVLKARTLGLIEARTPWLILGLAAGLITTKVVSIFETTLAENVILAFFIPVIVYMASAVGTQTQALYLRVYDTGEFKFGAYLFRELFVAGGIAVICSSLIFAYTFLIFSTLQIASVVGLAMLISILLAVVVASTIPALLGFFKKDPAIGSGPFSTALQDLLTLVVYFSVAQSIL